MRSGTMTQSLPKAGIAFTLPFADIGPVAAAQRTVAVFDCGNADESRSCTLDWLVRKRLLVPGDGVFE